MLKRASIFLLVIVASLTLAEARERKTSNPIGPVYIHPKPVREVPVIEKPAYEKQAWDRSERQRPTFERNTRRATLDREKPQFDIPQRDPSLWEKTVLETKPATQVEPELREFPTQGRQRKLTGRHSIRRGVVIRY